MPRVIEGLTEPAPTMTLLRAVELIEDGNGTEEETISAWQWMYDSGNYRRLQGWYGRTVQALIQEGIIQG